MQPTRRHKALGRLIGIDRKIKTRPEDDHWERWGFETAVVSATINRELFYRYDKPERRAAKGELGLRVEDPVVLFVGELRPEQGAELFLAMAKRYTSEGYQFVAAGTGPLGERFESSDDIHYHGFVENDRLPAFYNAADITVGPRERDVTSNVGLESIACGTPYITTAEGAIKDIFQDKGSYVWADRTPEAVMETVTELLSDETKYERQVERGLETMATEPYTLENALETHLQVYNNLVMD